MDFFTAQEHAQRNTGWLVLFFLLAVISLIVLTNLLVMLVFGYLHAGAYHPDYPAPFDWRIFLSVGCGVLLVVAGGTLYKIAALSGGGDAVAIMFGAEPVFADDNDLRVKTLVHVVEEMAIASGTPVPQVYLLNENGINAFAAGFSASDAIIAVTRGAVEKLNREQLQGVIAHEFSHILNGDMRLNVRLLGILHGILLIGLIGHQILRGSGRSRKGSGGVVLGFGLMTIGYAGTFFGKLIKAAVSRQREFLADAAAVQFTRNPQGIGGALLRIGAGQEGSLMRNPRSAEFSHAFFGQSIPVALTSLFATHPPLADRIRRILPDWDGVFAQALPEAMWAAAPAVAGSRPARAIGGLTGEELVSRIGQPDKAELEQAHHLVRHIPQVLRKAARDPFAARALLLFLLLDRDERIRKKQLEELKKTADRGVSAETLRLVRQVGGVRPDQRLPLIELALPTLRRLSEPQAAFFVRNIEAMIRADDRITIFEWCLRRIVTGYLDDYFGKPAKSGERISDPGEVREECAVLLSTLVSAVRHVGLAPEEVFAGAAAVLGLAELELVPAKRLSSSALDQALRVLVRLRPRAKERLLKACVAAIEADAHIDPAEAELVRAVAAALKVPMPLVAADPVQQP